MGTPDAYTPVSANTDGVFSANLTLNESIDMNIFTNAAYIGENAKLVVKLGGAELSSGQYELREEVDGRICICYRFYADRMNEELTVSIVDQTTGEASVEIALSIRSYAHMCLDAYPEDNILCAMLVAMLDYGALAQQYADTNPADLANRYVTAEQRAWLTNYPWPET